MKYESVMATERSVKIPADAEAWELYSDMKGAGHAARSLTAALKKALKASTRERAISIMSKALEEQAAFGAKDTEPMAHAEACLTAGRGSDYSWSL